MGTLVIMSEIMKLDETIDKIMTKTESGIVSELDKFTRMAQNPQAGFKRFGEVIAPDSIRHKWPSIASQLQFGG